MKNYIRNDYILTAFSSILFTVPFIIEGLSFLAWVCLVPLFFSIENGKSKNYFKIGLIFGTLLNYFGQYWLVGTLSRFGGFPLPVGILFILVYCMYLGIQYGIFTYLVAKFKLLTKFTLQNLLFIGAIWVVLEYFYPQLFPYNIGNSQGLNINVIQVVDLFGVNFLSFIIVFINLSVYAVLKSFLSGDKKPYSVAVFAVFLLFFIFLYGNYRIHSEQKNILKAEKIDVGVVQANFDFLEKIENNSELIIQSHKRMSLEIENVDLIIWPESAVLEFLPPDSEYLEIEGVMAVPKINDTFFFTGGLSFELDDNNNENRDYEVLQYNSAFLTDGEGKILGKYNKIKLLLFGEYLPFSDILPSIKKLSPASGDFTPGSELNIMNVYEKGIKIGPLICYEDIIPGFSREFAKKGANILINLTNDAWFGKSFAPYQHLLVAIPRAVETRRYLIRSTNTGVSVVVDSIGNIKSRTGIFKKEIMTQQVALLYGETLYTRVGDIFPWICLASFILFIFNKYLRKRYS
jgi:apolipoprotein N-acyltransferase